MARHTHVAAPRGPTWTHVGAYVAQRTLTMLIGPTGKVGPGDRLGGRTKPSG